MTVDRNRLHHLASLQNAVFTRRQALSAGVSATALKCDADAGRVKRVLPNAYIIAGAPNSWEQSVLAAVRSAEQPAVASHHTAAYLWGLVSRRPPVIEISMHRWLRAIRDYRVHESTDLVPDDCTELRHIPITTPARTVVDLGATNQGLVAEALDAGVRLGRFQLEDVARVVGRVARRGRRGVGTIKPLLADAARLGGPIRGRSRRSSSVVFSTAGRSVCHSRWRNTRFETRRANSSVAPTSPTSKFCAALRSTGIFTASIGRRSAAIAVSRTQPSSSVGAPSATHGGTWSSIPIGSGAR